MDAKLTLKLEKKVIDRAKQYARKRNTSVSRLVERYLHKVASGDRKDEATISPLVKSLSGVIKMPKNFDFRKEYGEYLIKKYK
jgi:hypothetical protein